MRTKELLEYYEQNILPEYNKYLSGKITSLSADYISKLRAFYIKLNPASAFSCWTCGSTIKSALESLSANYQRNKPKAETVEEPLLSTGSTLTLPVAKTAKKIIKKNKNK